MRQNLLCFLLLAICSPAWAQTITVSKTAPLTATELIQSDLITAPDHVDPGGYFTVRTPPNLDYKIDPEPKDYFRTVEEGTGVRVLFVLYAKAPGYTITIDHAVVHPTDEETKAAPWDDRVKFADWLKTHSADEIYKDTHFVKVGTGPDPGPDPDPDPDPEPDVKPPIPEPGFRVFIFYESSDTIPELQRAIISGEESRAYLDKTCITEPDGTAGYRIYDDDADLSNELPLWQKAFQRRPKSLPWVIISNGVTGTEEPLPESPSKFLELCKKYEVK